MSSSVRDRLRWLAFVVILCGLAPAAVGACGEEDQDLPDGAAAKVGDHVITKENVQRAVAGRIGMRHSVKTMPPYLPTDVEACVASLSKDRGNDLGRDELRTRCEEERDRSETAALRFLIQGQWYRLDHKKRGVPIPPEREAARWASDHSGVPLESFRGVTGTYLVKYGIAQRVGNPPEPSQAQIAAHYRTHRSRYVEAVKRFGPVVIVPTRAEADAVAAMLQGGRTPQQIVDAKPKGVTIVYGAKTVFRVEGAELREGSKPGVGKVGLVEEERGWVVYRLRDLLPLQEQYSLRAVRNRVLEDIQRRYVRNRVAKYDERLRAAYGDDTVCADEYRVPECR